MLVLNCLDEDKSTTVGGNTFFFKAKQLKHFHNEDIAKIIVRNKAEDGFVELPNDLEYLAHIPPHKTFEEMASPEHLKIIEDARKKGIENYIAKLRKLVYNAQVSLPRDLARKDYKYDPRIEYSDGDLHNIQQLLKYQTSKEDASQAKIEKIKELEKKLGK